MNIINRGKSMNILSLCDGDSCLQVALVKAQKDVDKYYSCEIDPYSSSVTRINFPNTIELGDLENPKIPFHMLPEISLLCSGFPCQDLSHASKDGKGLEGKRSGLFYQVVDTLKVLKSKNPNIRFLFENVKMKSKWENIITDTLKEIDPSTQLIKINSASFSGQNRQRLYWTNIPVDQSEIPEDSGIMLKDILESGITDRNKSHCLDANYFKGGNLKSYFDKHRRQIVFESNSKCKQIGEADLKGYRAIKAVYSDQGKSPCLTTMGGGHREPKVYVPPMSYRKLSPLECERLQTVPDNYTKCGQKLNGDIVEISNTQRYKMLGNSFTCNVIKFLIKNL
jgi:DNA-cytosine methyltransferase